MSKNWDRSRIFETIFKKYDCMLVLPSEWCNPTWSCAAQEILQFQQIANSKQIHNFDWNWLLLIAGNLFNNGDRRNNE
jgi:hypothetical protein